MVIRSPICEPEKLAQTISIPVVLKKKNFGVGRGANTFSDTMIRFIQSENLHMHTCN